MVLRRRDTIVHDTHDVDPDDFDDFDAPDTDDVLGEEPEAFDIRPVPVEVQGAVRVEQPGPRAGGIYTVQVPLSTSGTPVKLLNDDPRRETATIVALDSDIYIGLERGDVIGSPGAGRWPAAVPMVYRLTDELWATAVTVATTVTVVVEQWAR